MSDADPDLEFRPGEDLGVAAATDWERARWFRDVLGRFASGVTVVTSLVEGRPVGMTCQSFSSVSLEPPLVLFVPARTSHSWPLIHQSGHFCVNFLAADQERVSVAMASRGIDKFAEVGWRLTPLGAPLLDGVVGYVDCTIEAVHEAGDHLLVLGRVHDLDRLQSETVGREPLLYFEGRYRSITGEA